MSEGLFNPNKVAEIVKKFRHWIDDIEVMVVPTILTSMFYGSRRSTMAFYNPLVAFKNIFTWIQNIREIVKVDPAISAILKDDGRNAIEQLYILTCKEGLSSFKENLPIKSAEHLEYFIEYHRHIVRCVVDLKHRLIWAIEELTGGDLS